MSERLRGRSAFVTGAGSGIGRATALKFAREGASVTAVDVDEDAVHETVRELRGEGHRGLARVADVRDRQQIKDAVAAALAAFGKLDALVNNAGVFGTPAPLLEMDESVWDRVLEINLQGTYRVTRAVLPHIILAGGGTVVNVASTASHVVGGGGAAYTTSKHAILGFTRQLAHDYAARGVRVNAVCPGAVDTGLTQPIWVAHPEALATYSRVPAGRIGTPEEIANTVAYLSSDEAGFIHGIGLVIDGGLMLS